MLINQQLHVRKFFTSDENQALPDYESVWHAMKAFTKLRDQSTIDQCWLLEHPKIFTLGRAAGEQHVLDPGPIPVLRIDRGGQVTYHGPGQIMVYTLIDLKRRKLTVRGMVDALEASVIQLMANYGLTAYSDKKAPGVYIDGCKIAALGLRISRGCSYHGLCFNYDFDSSPFNRINPCGFAELQVTQLSELLSQLPDKKYFAEQLVRCLSDQLSYTEITNDYSLWTE
tara:strand:- start:797 stop:1477 length:681 start_codon:yes stop_codon:yes gene_type:complete